jgi:hypothetical protein
VIYRFARNDKSRAMDRCKVESWGKQRKINQSRQQPGPHGGSLASQLVGSDWLSFGFAGTLSSRSSRVPSH